MTLPAINSLANMEYMLYGGASGLNANTPSYMNGYMANNGLYGNYMYNPSLYNNAQANGANSTENQSVNTGTKGTASQSTASAQDLKTLSDYYAKELSPSESLASAVIMGGAFGALSMHPRLITHPWNSITTLKEVNDMFKGVRVDGSDMNKLWRENNAVMRDAYFRMHKAAARSKSKLNLIRQRYTKEEYTRLKNMMQQALDSKDINKIAEASSALERAYVNNGRIPRAWNKIKNFFGSKSEVPTVASRLADTKAIEQGAKTLISDNKMSFTKALKKGGGVKGGIFFAAIELFMNWDKIKTAFSKDDSTGWKQVGQTTTKAVGNAIGWAAGEAAGVWAATALGAKIGTIFGPGIGTVIGGIAGFVGGSIGMWLAGKATKAIVGQDVADKVTANNLTKTPEGQTQLLSLVSQKVQSGEKVPENVIFSANKILAGMEQA